VLNLSERKISRQDFAPFKPKSMNSKEWLWCRLVFVINKAGLDKISIISDLCTPIRNSEIKEEPHLEVGQPQPLRLPHERSDVDRDGLPLI
jgi:hypothetical protein